MELFVMSDISAIHERFYILFIQNWYAQFGECCGQEPLTGNEVMGKGTIIDFTVSAGGTFSLEDSQIHRFFLNLLNYPVHALLINGGKIHPLFVDDTSFTEFHRRPGNRHAGKHFRAYGDDLFTTEKGMYRRIMIISTVVFDILAKQTGADQYSTWFHELLLQRKTGIRARNGRSLISVAGYPTATANSG